MSSSFFSWCHWRKWGHWNLRRREILSPRLPCVTTEVWGLLLSLFASKVTWFSACGWLEMIKPMVVDFFFIGAWCYSGWCVWFENICIVFKTVPIISWTVGSQSGGISIRLGSQFMVVTAGFQPWGPQFESYG